MKRYTFRLLKLFFAAEIGVFGYLYVYGSQGLKAVDTLKQQIKNVEQLIERAGKEVDELEEQNKNWQQHAYYKEKMAREQLQMARPDDQVFYW